MAYVVGLVASPSKAMNTDTLVSEALRGAASVGARTEKLYLNDLSIRPCQACPSPPQQGYCLVHDGMDVVYGVLEEADALVVGTHARRYGLYSSRSRGTWSGKPHLVRLAPEAWRLQH